MKSTAFTVGYWCMGGDRFLISKQISDFWMQISADFTSQCTRFLLLPAPRPGQDGNDTGSSCMFKHLL